MTDVFKKYDEDRDGYITLSFEQFLTGEFCVRASREWGSLVCCGGIAADIVWQRCCGNGDDGERLASLEEIWELMGIEPSD